MSVNAIFDSMEGEMILRTAVIVLLSACLLTTRSASAGDPRELARIQAELRVASGEYFAILKYVPSEFDDDFESRPEPIQIVLPGSSGDDPPFLRLRGADLADAFYALNDLIGGGFVVDAALDVRVSADFPATASVEEVLEAFSSAGVAIGPGPIRTVTPASVGSVSAEARAGAPGGFVTFTVKDAALSDILCLIGSVAEREVRAPEDLAGRVSIYATDVPLGDLVDALLAASGLVSNGMGDMVFRRAGTREAASVNPCAAPSSWSSRLRPEFETVLDIRAADIELFGLGPGGSPRAYIYGPARRPISLEAGAEIKDATVRSIDGDGIVLARRDGSEMRVPLSPEKPSSR